MVTVVPGAQYTALGLVGDPLIAFTVSGKPEPWARAGVTGKRRWTKSKDERWRAAVQIQAKLAFRARGYTEPLDGTVGLVVVAHVAPPKDYRGPQNGQLKYTQPDVDNYAKGVMDALERCGVLRNDSRVALAIDAKLWDPRWQGVEVLLYVAVGSSTGVPPC